MKTIYVLKMQLHASLVLATLALGMQNSFAQEICLSSSNQLKGDKDGFHYELWNPTTGANECMTLNSGATFSGKWSNAEDYLARRGLFYGDNHGKTYKDRGGYEFKYTIDWQPQYVEDGNDSIGLYGWVHRVNNKGTTAEFYVTENWLTWNHGKDRTAQLFGAIFVNGKKYGVYRTTRTNQPTPWGNQDFYQYVSVRLNTDTDNLDVPPNLVGVINGTINVTQHFAAWEKLGLDMSGELYEVAMLAEGFRSSGTFNVSQLDIATVAAPTSIAFTQSTYNLNVDQQLFLNWSYSPSSYGSTNVMVVSTSSNKACNNVSLWNYRGQWIMSGMSPGTCTLTIVSPDGLKTGTATVTVGAGTAQSRLVETRALGTKGGEQIFLLRDGKRFNQGRALTTSFQTFTDTVYGDGEISVEFVNDDVVANGRDVRVDYISVDGIKRETEAMAVNTGAYGNGKCGGGSYTEWLNCSGAVKYGPLKQEHTITVRARGTVGGEHIVLLINGQTLNAGWSLGTGFLEYTVNFIGDGDINVKFDNNGGSKDVVVDWVKVDSQGPRQAESMLYNTAVFANGRCGGGSRSEWMHCNGVIGFGKISDTY
jgi:hypothetical protein